MADQFILSLLLTIFSISLSVGNEDVPNPPLLRAIYCDDTDATVHWVSRGDNRVPISRFIIEYNTTFTPETWTEIASNVPATELSYNVPLSPWANFTFRVIAVNKIGKSLPSDYSDVCSTAPDVPYKNPDDVKAESDQSDNLVITWTPMPEIEHHADNFRYRLFWREDTDGTPFQTHDIPDWEVNSYVVNNQPTSRRYRVKVLAVNEIGEAKVPPQEVLSDSGSGE